MSQLDLSPLGIPLIEMRCPQCNQTQYAKIHGLEPHLSRCCHCKELLVYTVVVREKPNNVLLTIAISPVPQTKAEPSHEDNTE